MRIPASAQHRPVRRSDGTIPAGRDRPMTADVRAGFFTHSDTRTIAVRRWMIEATRDDDGDANLAAALMLAQTTFWTQPDERTGKVRAGHDHGAHAWLVRADDEWEEELGLSARTARRARKRLEALGWIEAKVLVDAGVRCTHIRRLTPAAEPSTIRPEVEVETVESIDGSGQVSQPVLAESHAGAILSCSGEVIGDVNPPAADAAEEKPDAEAREIVTAYWDWCTAQNRPKPTLTGGNPYMALVKIVARLLEADWAAIEIKHALVATRAFTLDALTFTLRERRDRSGPRAPISTDRALPSGRVEL